MRKYRPIVRFALATGENLPQPRLSTRLGRCQRSANKTAATARLRRGAIGSSRARSPRAPARGGNGLRLIKHEQMAVIGRHNNDSFIPAAVPFSPLRHRGRRRRRCRRPRSSYRRCRHGWPNRRLRLRSSAKSLWDCSPIRPGRPWPCRPGLDSPTRSLRDRRRFAGRRRDPSWN